MDKIQQEYALCAYLMTVTGAVAASATTAGTAIDAIYGNLIVIRRQLSVHCRFIGSVCSAAASKREKRKESRPNGCLRLINGFGMNLLLF